MSRAIAAPIQMPHHLTTLPLLAGAALLLIAYWAILLQRFRTLRWPRRIGYYSFKYRIIYYLRRSGWAVNNRAWVPVDFYARKKGRWVAGICVPSDIEVTTSRIRDLASLPPNATKLRPVVCITVERIARHHVEDAAQNGVRIIWYKELNSL